MPIRRTSSAVIVSLALADGGRTLLEVVSADFEKLVSRIDYIADVGFVL